MSVCVCTHTFIYILFSLFMVYLYLAPFLHSVFPLPYISFLLYNSFPLLFTILFAFLIYLAIYGCFELVLPSYSFLSNLIFLSLFFKPLWSLFLYILDPIFFCPSSTSPPNPHSNPQFLSPCTHVSLWWLLQLWLCSLNLSRQDRWRRRHSREKSLVLRLTT